MLWHAYWLQKGIFYIGHMHSGLFKDSTFFSLYLFFFLDPAANSFSLSITPSPVLLSHCLQDRSSPDRAEQRITSLYWWPWSDYVKKYQHWCSMFCMWFHSILQSSKSCPNLPPNVWPVHSQPFSAWDYTADLQVLSSIQMLMVNAISVKVLIDRMGLIVNSMSLIAQ